MGFLKLDVTEESIQDYTGSGEKWLFSSGIFEVLIKSVIVDSSPNGSEYLNFWLTYNGQDQMLYQAIRLTNNDGSDNLEKKLFTKFCVVAGLNDGDTVSDPVAHMLPVGKNGAEVECMVLEDFNDTPMMIRLQMSYSIYNGKIQEKKILRNVFRYEDNATAAEIVNDSEDKGKQHNTEMEYADQTQYNDGLTAEDIVKWKQSLKSENKTPTAKNNKPANGFSKRKFGK